MDKLIMDFNMGFFDKCNRFITGGLLLILSMSITDAPPWVALTALYPILTAIVAWDPVYAIIRVLRTRLLDKLTVKGGELVLE